MLAGSVHKGKQSCSPCLIAVSRYPNISLSNTPAIAQSGSHSTYQNTYTQPPDTIRLKIAAIAAITAITAITAIAAIAAVAGSGPRFSWTAGDAEMDTDHVGLLRCINRITIEEAEGNGIRKRKFKFDDLNIEDY